jgi:hypothetical protein
MTASPVVQIADLLRETVIDSEQVEGLHYAVFLPRGPDGLPLMSFGNSRVVNDKAIETMLRLLGIGHPPEEQVRLWDGCILDLHRSFQSLETFAQSKAKGRDPHLARLVLDLEVGGVFYAAVDDFGWLFAATLNQQSMNDGRAEAQLSKIGRALRSVLSR